MSLALSFSKKLAIFAAISVPVLLTGCANMVTTASETNAFNVAGTMSGKLYGGNQPVTGSTLKAYAVGTTGYGSAGTLLATTTTGADGSFAFSQVTTGATGPSGSSYSCPTSNTLVYIIASGGNTVGTGNNNNTAAVFLAAVGPCSTAASSFLSINEITSAASIFALGQYINPGTSTPASATIGSPNTAQALTGIRNAFAAAPNLARFSDGTPIISFTPTAGPNAAGVTVTGTPESSKLITIADILAACINNPDATAPNCGTLFANAVPPAPAVTSQPGATFPTAVDTLQAGYYMATNPANGSAAATTNLYNLASGVGAPFQPTLSTVPSDWTLGITYSSASTCAGANNAAFIGSMESVAIDAAGNVWFNNGATTAVNALGELSPTGAPTTCAFGTIPSGRGLTIDPVGNVWTTGASTTLATNTSVYEYLTAGTTLNWPTAQAANGIVADGNGNIFYAPATATTTLVPFQEYLNAALVTAVAPSIPVGGNVNPGSTGLLYVSMDTAGRIWDPATSAAIVYDLYPGGATPTNGYTLIDAGTASLTTAIVNNGYGAAIDAAGHIFGGSTCCSAAASNTFFKITPGTTAGTATGTISAKFAGGLVAPRSTAVDGAGNVWAGMGYPVVTAALSPTATNIFGLAEVDNNLNSISYAGPNGAAGFTGCTSTGSNCPTLGAFQKASLGTVRSLAIDPSGNVWAASNGSAQVLVEFVGAAVPVVTPLSIGIKNNTLGTKP